MLLHWDAATAHLALIVCVCGIGTFALRWFPVWRAIRQRAAADPNSRMARLSASLGPTAIAALLVASLLPLLRTADSSSAPETSFTFSGLRLGAAVIATAVIALTARIGWGIASRTFAGAAAWGLCLAGARFFGIS